MSAPEMIFLTFILFVAGTLSVAVGEIFAHLVLYRRRGQVAKKKTKRDGRETNSTRFIDLIKND